MGEDESIGPLANGVGGFFLGILTILVPLLLIL